MSCGYHHLNNLQGGHFAALECPTDLYQDLLDFLEVAWKKA